MQRKSDVAVLEKNQVEILEPWNARTMILELWNCVSELKSSVGGFGSKLDTAAEWNSDLEIISENMIQHVTFAERKSKNYR